MVMDAADNALAIVIQQATISHNGSPVGPDRAPWIDEDMSGYGWFATYPLRARTR